MYHRLLDPGGQKTLPRRLLLSGDHIRCPSYLLHPAHPGSAMIAAGKGSIGGTSSSVSRVPVCLASVDGHPDYGGDGGTLPAGSEVISLAIKQAALINSSR